MRFVIFVPALALAGCGGVYTQREFDDAVERAGEAAYVRARDEARARLKEVFLRLGKSESEASELAEAEAERAGRAAAEAAEELARRALGPLRSEGEPGPWGKALAAILGAALQVGLTYVETRSRRA